MKYKNRLINGIILFTGDSKSHGRSLGQTFFLSRTGEMQT